MHAIQGTNTQAHTLQTVAYIPIFCAWTEQFHANSFTPYCVKWDKTKMYLYMSILSAEKSKFRLKKEKRERASDM